MTKLSAEKFRDLLDHVRRSISSLKGCLEREIPNEARLLAMVRFELEGAVPLRPTAELEARKAGMLAAAHEALSTRVARAGILGCQPANNNRASAL